MHVKLATLSFEPFTMLRSRDLKIDYLNINL